MIFHNKYYKNVCIHIRKHVQKSVKSQGEILLRAVWCLHRALTARTESRTEESCSVESCSVHYFVPYFMVTTVHNIYLFMSFSYFFQIRWEVSMIHIFGIAKLQSWTVFCIRNRHLKNLFWNSCPLWTKWIMTWNKQRGASVMSKADHGASSWPWAVLRPAWGQHVIRIKHWTTA